MNIAWGKIIWLLAKISMGLVSLLLVTFLAIALLWKASFLFFLVTLALLVFLPAGLSRRWVWVTKAALLTVVLALLMAFIHVPFGEVEKQTRFFRGKLNTQGPSSFTLSEKMAIYGANLTMGMGAFALGMPEAGWETLLICVPGKKTRTWRSDFAMESSQVRKKLKKTVRILNGLSPGVTQYEMPEVRIAWRGYFNDSRRVAFALNAFRLSANARREGEVWRIECKGWVPVKYPRRSWTKMLVIRSKPFYFEEGLYWALQQEGWLFPYKAYWAWTIHSNDARLR